jgi:hypothetical protein
MMSTARDIMHTGAECIGEHETLQYAAQRMRDLDVGALPICEADPARHLPEQSVGQFVEACGRRPFRARFLRPSRVDSENGRRYRPAR